MSEWVSERERTRPPLPPPLRRPRRYIREPSKETNVVVVMVERERVGEGTKRHVTCQEEV